MVSCRVFCNLISALSTQQHSVNDFSTDQVWQTIHCYIEPLTGTWVTGVVPFHICSLSHSSQDFFQRLLGVWVDKHWVTCHNFYCMTGMIGRHMLKFIITFWNLFFHYNRFLLVINDKSQMCFLNSVMELVDGGNKCSPKSVTSCTSFSTDLRLTLHSGLMNFLLDRSMTVWQTKQTHLPSLASISWTRRSTSSFQSLGVLVCFFSNSLRIHEWAVCSVTKWDPNLKI